MATPILTAERLREVLRYDPATGVFTSLAWRGQRLHIGDVAGTVNKKGYRYISIDKRKFLAHRLAWFYVTGVWPQEEIDHKNGMKDENWFENLRPATHLINQQNQRRAHSVNKLGVLGVIFHRGCFRAHIKVDGKTKYVGAFATRELAHEAYVDAKRKLHEGCTI